MALWTLQALSDTDWGADQDKGQCSWIHHLLLWYTNCLQKQRHERCCFVKHRDSVYWSFRSCARTKAVLQLLQSMEIQVQLPIKVHVDNAGAIWLAKNNSSDMRTRHIDIRAHFINHVVLDGMIDIFVMSAHNDSDLFMKNLPSCVFLATIWKVRLNSYIHHWNLGRFVVGCKWVNIHNSS